MKQKFIQEKVQELLPGPFWKLNIFDYADFRFEYRILTEETCIYRIQLMYPAKVK
jgi:hypothetical protein